MGAILNQQHKEYLALYLPAPNVATALALRWFIRAIFTPFLYKFNPHTHPACYVQMNDFY